MLWRPWEGDGSLRLVSIQLACFGIWPTWDTGQVSTNETIVPFDSLGAQVLENVSQQQCNYRTQTQFCQRPVLANGQVGLIWALFTTHCLLQPGVWEWVLGFMAQASLWSFPSVTCHSCWNRVRVAVSLLSATWALTGPCSFWTGPGRAFQPHSWASVHCPSGRRPTQCSSGLS